MSSNCPYLKIPTLRKICSLLLASLLISACGSNPDSESQTLTIFAASSLTDVFNNLSTEFEAQHPNIEVQMQYAGSAQLAIQITQGAPVDIFASANAQQMQVVTDDKLTQGTPMIFAHNQLVLIVPRDNPAGIQEFQDIGQRDLSIVTAIEGVPIRDYTDILLDNLAEGGDYGADFQRGFYANIRSEETNVRQIVLKIALGEADTAIVYRTDITAEVDDLLQIIEIPQAFAPQPMYLISIINTGGNSALAQEFLDFTMSEQGQTILEKYGFGGAGEVVAPATDEVAP